MPSFTEHLGFHASALQLRSRRNEMLASNIANAATPNFKARDIDFDTELKRINKTIEEISVFRTLTVDEINKAIKEAAHGNLKGILGYDENSLVSIDFNHSSESSTFAAQQTKVLPSGMSRILSWYDNEWGFSNRMADTAVAMGALL